MSEQVLVIHSVSEALEALKKVVESENFTPNEIKFEGEVTSLKVKIQGENYHATFPATFARELWEVQEEFYRAVLFTLGRPEHLNNLTAEEKKQYLITFHVQEGCTEVLASFGNFLNSLTDVMRNMESKHKLIAILGIAVVVGGGYFYSDVYKHKVDIDAKVSDEKERTEQLKIIKDIALGNPQTARFNQAMDNSANAMMRGAPDAESLTIGDKYYDKEQIENAKKRTPRAVAAEVRATDSYFIASTDYRSAEATKYTLRDMTGSEFFITVDHTKFKDDNLSKLHTAATKRERINLTLELIIVRDKVKLAELISVN